MMMDLQCSATRGLVKGLSLIAVAVLAGCNANGWMGDPTVGGYYKPTPTSIPILDRIDIIEEPTRLPQMTEVAPADLMPSDLEYRIEPGDVMDVTVYGLYAQGQRHAVQRRVDQGGYFRVPELGAVRVAGLTEQGAQEAITSALSKVLTHPSVEVSLLDQTGFTYTVYGGLARWGVFKLTDPNQRLVDVLALAGGVPQSTKKIYVIRQLPVSDSALPAWSSQSSNEPSPASSYMDAAPATKDPTATLDIEDLIKQLDDGSNSMEESPVPDAPLPADDGHIESLINNLDIGDNKNLTTSEPSVSPGVLQTTPQVPIDIDDLLPQRNVARQPVDVDEISSVSSLGAQTSDAAYVYVPESDSWIAVSTGPKMRAQSESMSSGRSATEGPKILERIIAVPWDKLRKGDSSYNIVIRPEDRIYVEPPVLGNLYVRGEISRPGVYNMPNTGEKISLTQFIISAGDLGPLAVPERVSITRRIGENIQATVTLNYAAILQQTEPDIFLKPNDIVNIGTNWGATPMAIIRNGFRATYGFGFLLDRNFGNDVFGRPP